MWPDAQSVSEQLDYWRSRILHELEIKDMYNNNIMSYNWQLPVLIQQKITSSLKAWFTLSNCFHHTFVRTILSNDFTV